MFPPLELVDRTRTHVTQQNQVHWKKAFRKARADPRPKGMVYSSLNSPLYVGNYTDRSRTPLLPPAGRSTNGTQDEAFPDTSDILSNAVVASTTKDSHTKAREGRK